MRKEILLSDDNWGLKYFDSGEGKKSGVYRIDFWPPLSPVADENTWPYGLGWLPTTVPGDVHSTLRRLKVIPDPYFGLDNEKCKWVSDKEWWYRKILFIPPEWQKEGKVFRLVFEGVDYSADFWVNGKYLGHHEGMFSPIVFNITDIINMFKIHGWQIIRKKNSCNTNDTKVINITVCISPPPKDRREIGGKKCNLGYAVDYAPHLLTIGIWKDVHIISTGEVYIEDIFVTSKFKNGKATVRIQIESCNSSKRVKETVYEIKIKGKNFHSHVYKNRLKIRLKPGRRSITMEIEIPDARLWWPWDRGEQNLYELDVKIISDREESDFLRQTFGIREVKMLKNEDSPKDSFPFTFSINGKKEYIRGVNWTNVDCLHENLKQERYSELLTLVKEANVNMLRIHGWHIIEKEDFYNLCDEMGILVWQEFPFCNMDYPKDKAYLKKVEEECSQSIKLVRNHPSLTVWCGGNEYLYKENRKLIDTLRYICEKNSPDHPFILISDSDRHYYPCDDLLEPETNKGDYHNWTVWHGFAPIVNYYKDNSLFTSEFGVQSVPDIESLKKFIPADELWPPGYSWEYHFAELYKINYYARYIKYGEYVRGKKTEEIFNNLEEFVENSQKAQAEVFKFGIEHYRCRKYKNSGSIFWCFNEPWPSVIGSVVDWYLNPKKAYYAARDAYTPILVSLQHKKKEWKRGEKFEGEVWIVNDYLQTFKDCTLEMDIADNKGNVLDKRNIRVREIEKDSAKKVFDLDFSFPEEIMDKFQIKLSLKNFEGLVMVKNNYDFRIKEDE
ncbi:MAG: hypothetical protein HY606_05645 [Planctomycetes bacterium]|nr:hypothetical protein [Planctomycetota bacterium]